MLTSYLPRMEVHSTCNNYNFPIFILAYIFALEFRDGMGLRMDSATSPYFWAFLRGGVLQAITQLLLIYQRKLLLSSLLAFWAHGMHSLRLHVNCAWTIGTCPSLDLLLVAKKWHHVAEPHLAKLPLLLVCRQTSWKGLLWWKWCCSVCCIAQ